MRSWSRTFVVLLLCGLSRSSALAGVVENVYSVALHQHASMSEGSGNVEWHAEKAAALGLDLIWWTDHDWRVDHWNHTTRYDFETATIDPITKRVSEFDAESVTEMRFWDRVSSTATHDAALVDSLASEGSRSLKMEAFDALSGPSFRKFTYLQRGSRTQNRYSLAKRVRLKFSLFPEVLDPVDARFVLEAELSEHPNEDHLLRYVVGTTAGEGVNTQSLPFVVGQWNHYEVDLTADAIQLFTSGGPDSLRGEDNSIFMLRMGLEVRNGAEAIVFFDDYQILTDPSLDGNALLQKNRDFGTLYETMYPGVTHHTGSEISRWRAQPHMNAYAPNHTLIDYTGFNALDTLYYAIDQVRAQGGAVSLNHMYGIGVYGNGTQEPPAQFAERVRGELVSIGAYGVDMLEVGYRARHGNDLDDHVKTWDALTGNAAFLTGTGVTDSHGTNFLHGWGPWVPGNPSFENNHVTWLFAPDSSEASLVHAMRAGRAFFGDPYLFDLQGSFDLVTTEGFRMGRVVVTDRTSHDLIVEIDGIPSSVDVRLLQGEIREDSMTPYVDVNFLRDEILSGTQVGMSFTDTVTIDTTTPSFVRVQVDETDGDPWVFSNPIAFLSDVPSDGVRAERVAAVIGDAKILSAEKFRLRSLDGSGLPTELLFTGDEEVLGQGVIELDPGVLGAPAIVVGASQFSIGPGGVVTIEGFQGTASAVSVRWGAVDAPADLNPRPTELALSTGRPNPFDQGVTTELALPDPGVVFLEVLDVSGRRIRVLLDEWRAPGRHSVVWDGRDTSGRSVADGVYFLRLSAGGRRVSTKAVKLR